MTFETPTTLPARASKTFALKPLAWLIAAAALAVTALMFAPVPPL